MQARTIQLTDEEAKDLHELRALTGETEADALRRAALHGLKGLRLDHGVRAFVEGRGSSEAASIAGIPRVAFLDILADRGVPMLDGCSSISHDLEALASRLPPGRLSEAARTLADHES